MSNSFDHSLDHVALNLDLKRPKTAARHLRSAVQGLYRLLEPSGSEAGEMGPWLQQSLTALRRADYAKAANFLEAAMEQLPPNSAHEVLFQKLSDLQICLQENCSEDVLKGSSAPNPTYQAP